MSWAACMQLAAVVVLGTAGQLMLKYALRQNAVGQPAGLRSLISVPMLGWLLSYIATTILWLMALRSVPLSQAFPILGLQFALIPLASAKLLDERVTPIQWVGVSIIVVGVGLVGQS